MEDQYKAIQSAIDADDHEQVLSLAEGLPAEEAEMAE